ncbi:MAG: pitrilysin family protein [Planctomycetia bacterium]|nr:pitrilysin family protein [Planctomycetia bacterium]
MNTNNKVRFYDNGLVLLGEQMDWCESVSLTLLLPFGTIYDPADRLGLAGMTAEMLTRGSGQRSNREFLAALENLGIDSSEDVFQSYSVFSQAMVADKLPQALPLFADLLRRPVFPEDELESARAALMQELVGLEDDPSGKLFNELDQIYFPAPWGRPAFGDAAGLSAVTLDDIRDYYQRHWHAEGAILGVAGRFDWDSLGDQIAALFGDWHSEPRALPRETERTTLTRHIPFDSSQTHLGLICPGLTPNDSDYWPLLGALNALSGGMSSRLFTEVREKRGLCYTVSASTLVRGDRGAVYCYCGTTAARAQESLDVILSELRKLTDGGVTDDELDKLKIQTKSGLIMQQESSVSRSRAIVRDWFRFGRIRTLSELRDKVDSLTCETINLWLKAHPFGPFRLVTLGEKPLSFPEESLG